MTPLEKKCKDMADVCELAHKRTVRDCKKRKINVDCLGIMDCTDGSQEHDGTDCTHYGAEAQVIFNGHYDHIINVTGI